MMSSLHSYRLPLVIIAAVAFVAVQPAKSSSGERYNNGAVATDVPDCSEMGKSILENGGSAVDSAITSLLCIGVMNSQSSGIGGGFLMVVYNRSNEKVEVLNAHSTAPAAADPANFDGTEEDNKRAKFGMQAPGIPGEVLGMWEAHQRYGSLPWEDLFEPVINMARAGFQVGWHLRRSLRIIKGKYPDLEKFYLKEGRTRTAYEGETIKMPVLADTLQRIADNGPGELYSCTGHTALNFIHDVQEGGGDMTLADLENYRAKWTGVETLRDFSSSNYTVYSPPLSFSSGPYLQFMLRTMDGLGVPPNVNNISTMNFADQVELYHQWLEVCKFGFGARTRLGDTQSALVNQTLANLRSDEFSTYIHNLIADDVTFTWSKKYGREFDYDLQGEDDEEAEDEEDEGDTSQISVLAPNGDAVSVTTSVGNYFGCRAISNSTGIIPNSRMSNFNYDWKYKTWILPDNSLAPGKYPLTTMGPSIIVDQNYDVKMIVGSSGGPRIPSANAWVIIRTLLMNAELADAIEENRIQNFILTNKAYYEELEGRVSLESVADSLRDDRGHRTASSTKFAVVQGIVKYPDGIAAHSDTRKRGLAAGY